MIPNATPGPANATTKPPIAGPSTRAVVPRLDISATAFGRSFEPTIWKTSACRAGPSSAATTPPTHRQRVDLPDRDPAAERQHRERGREHARQHLARDRRPPHVEAVDHRPHEEAEQRRRQQHRQREHADRDGRVGELQQQPRGRDLLHPVAGERHGLAPEVEPEVAVLADARERARADAPEHAHACSFADHGRPPARMRGVIDAVRRRDERNRCHDRRGHAGASALASVRSLARSSRAVPTSGGRDGDRARDGERELGAADRHEPAREEAADRRSAQERPEVEARRPPAQVLRRLELDRGQRRRAPLDVTEPRQEQQHADDADGRLRREDQLEHAVEERAAEQVPQAVRSAPRGREGADERARAEDRGDQAEGRRAAVERSLRRAAGRAR